MTQGESGRIVHSPEQFTGSVVAVTGPRTFLGRNLLGLCEADPRVRRLVVVDHETPLSAGPKTCSYVVDRSQPDAAVRIAEIFSAENVDTVVHLGFLDSPTRNTAWAHELESVGTHYLLNACREGSVQKLVVASMAALYGPHSDNPNFLSESHPLRGLRGVPFLSDKIEAERELDGYVRDQPKACVTVLRFAPLIGPTVNSYVTRWLAQRSVLTLLGFDPLLQCVHEVDALSALRLALQRNLPGVFNIAAPGVLPVSTVIKLAGRSSLPVPHFVAHRLAALMWLAGLSEVPAPMLRYLRHLCVVDAARAEQELGFSPAYTTREAVVEFGATLRLREARLLPEAYG